MAKAIFVTGTGTDVGKTYVTGLLLKKMNEMGKKAAYYKAAMSGNERDSEGNLIPGDAVSVKETSGIGQPSLRKRIFGQHSFLYPSTKIRSTPCIRTRISCALMLWFSKNAAWVSDATTVTSAPACVNLQLSFP